MANQATPGAVANTHVRYLLTKAGLAAGGLATRGADNQWEATQDFFGNKCAYTGEDLTGKPIDKDHAIALNRVSGGLHVFGNVVPSTPKANAQKSGRRYDDFLRSKGEKFDSIAHLTDEQREAAIARIEAFMQQARPDGLLKPHPELLAFYETQYQKAKELCATGAQELEELLNKLNLAAAPLLNEAVAADEATLDLPSVEQFELEETGADNLPEAYRQIQARSYEMNVGAYAQAVFAQLFADGTIAKFLPNLTYREDLCTFALKLSFPPLITRRQDAPTRYYATPYRHNGTEYYLCSQWYERNREPLSNWLTEMVFAQRA
ncbi:HNH endonuclease signature motif containing protein [Hymenobacter terrestris]|uniref:HNH endonuclease n=1 Tax=Hymenobacter terrestris TaxID=2748310 RepID=A0ABX2Q443_9BACT|nr:HNH endonuclease signature motif containing protein [Hymenobacter terrestris]NVO84494.1 HNH endonuclease [Hymenobacter terrestris]